MDATEIIRHEPYDNSADVYNFGILMFGATLEDLFEYDSNHRSVFSGERKFSSNCTRTC